MKIAVTYNQGEVFQHFGRTEAFKIYEVEENKVISSKLFDPNGVGHEALAGLLAQESIDVLICGGLGQGAQDALAEAGIEVCSGASGNTDEAVEAYLRGELVSSGVNCDHHDEAGEEEGCGGGCGGCGGEGGCGGGCGGCGGCGEMQPIMEGKNVGKNVKVHYRGTLDDGTEFDSSYGRGEPLAFVSGVGMMIPGFDRAVANMEIGEVVQIHLEPAEAYGEKDPEAIFTVKIADMPGTEQLVAGQQVFLSNPFGQRFPALVTAKDDENITFDANHELAGKALNFQIELLEVTE